MLGNNREPDKKGKEQSKRFPPSTPFAGNDPRSGKQQNNSNTGNLNKQVPQSPKSPDKKMDNFQRTNKAERGTGPLMANSNMDLSKAPPANRDYTEVSLDDGVTIIRYKEPQKIDNLIQDAKARVGTETSKFFSKGWVIGNELAKISPDGLSITFYPQEVANLVQELIGYPNADEDK
jgi:hypothetical protein